MSKSLLTVLTLLLFFLTILAEQTEKKETEPEESEEVIVIAEGDEKKKEDKENDKDSDGKEKEDEIVAEIEEEIVVTSSGIEKNRLYTMQPVDVVDTEEINEEMPVTATEVLKQIPGVSLSSPAGGFFSNPIIRGLGGRRVIMVIDGQRIDTEKTVGVTGYFVEVQDLKQMEVMKGPGSVLYGSDAISGVINLISKDVLDMYGFSAGNTLIYGTNNREASDYVYAGWGNKKVAFKLMGKFRDSVNMTDGSGNELENSFYEDRNYSFKFAWKPANRHILRANGSFYDGGDIGKTANSGDDAKRRRIYFPKDRHYMANLKYEIKDYRIIKKTSFAVYTDFTDRLQHVDFYTGAWIDDRTVTDLDQTVEKNGNFFNLGWAYSTTLKPLKFTEIIFGTDGHYKHLDMKQTSQSMQVLPNGKTLPAEYTYPFDDSSQTKAAVFLQAEQLFFEQLALKAGARYDVIHTEYFYNEETYENNSIYGDRAGETSSKLDHAFSGNIGLLYSPFKELIVSFNFGRAFRSPTLREKYAIVDSCKGRYIGNDELEPEASLNFDLGIKGKIKYFIYEVYGFTTLVDNLIAGYPTENDNEYKYENVVDARLYGAEGRLIFNYPDMVWKFGMKVSTSLGYVYGENAAEDKPLPNIPPLKNIDSLRLYLGTFSFIDKVFAEARFTWNSEQDRINPGLNTGSVEETVSGSYYLFDLLFGLSTRSFQGFTTKLNFSIFNIADAAYRDHLSPINGMGRNMKIGLNLNYEL